MIKKLFILLAILLPIKAQALIEVDITRGNLSPLPVAVSPLSIDENSKKGFVILVNRLLNFLSPF